MKKKNLIVAGVSVIILAAVCGVFDLFVLSPGRVRQSCEKYATENTPSYEHEKYTNNLYRGCLAKNGMQPESLYVNLD